MELIDLVINEDDKDNSGVTGVATVDVPATNESYFAFNSQKPKKYTIHCSSSTKGSFKPVGDKQILAGALMIPDMEIYRVSEETGKEFNVRFKKETIETIVKKFSRLGYANSINQMHDPNKKIEGSYLFQSFIINRDMGVMPPLGQDHLPDGTWFGMVYIGDKVIWDAFIKTGIYTGFSVEGNFYEKPVEPGTEDEDDEDEDFKRDLAKWLNEQIK
jgi:hypothetical protein